ncbi:MAG: class I SAM-dependent methyltransferase [Elusimicrobia bacterium]|nr:class I SAM-dependent methyltransferase [Elusimicrobiota bacterium]
MDKDAIELYDAIGRGYTAVRRPDPRLAERLTQILDLPAQNRLLDVGAGAGAYTNLLAERGYHMTALEPSQVMRSQAMPHRDIVWVEGHAEALPFDDGAFDGAICTHAFHHFADRAKAAAEMARVTGGGPIVLFTFDPAAARGFWLFDYFPDVLLLDQKLFPPIKELAALLRAATHLAVSVEPFPLPKNLSDLFTAAAWDRPALYLDPRVRAGMSTFARAYQSCIAQGVERLRLELESGLWHRKYGRLLEQETCGAGSCFVRLG